MGEATWWRIKAFITWIAAGIGVLLAYLHGFGLISHYIESQDEIHLAANIYIVFLFFAVTIAAALRQWMVIRKERYANITPLFHQILHQIRDLNTHLNLNEPKNGTQAEYDNFIHNAKMVFGRILDQLNIIFVSITSTSYRTSIKLTYEKNNKLYVYTLTRDQGSRQKCQETDNRRINDDHDPLEKNTQFARLFTDKEEFWHYFCNDLTSDENFQATSLTAYAPELATRAPSSKSKKSWPLPYKSTIACVIRQGPFDIHQNIKPEVLGFLTVDSESRNVFVERWDAQIMLAIADALYGPVRCYLSAQNRAQHVKKMPQSGTD